MSDLNKSDRGRRMTKFTANVLQLAAVLHVAEHAIAHPTLVTLVGLSENKDAVPISMEVPAHCVQNAIYMVCFCLSQYVINSEDRDLYEAVSH